MSAPSLDQFRYQMNHGRRGLFIVVNNRNFGNGGQYNTRLGSEIDTVDASELFTNLGFKVEVGKDLRCEEMLGLMEDAANLDHSDADCFGALIMSHGEDGVICGTDESIAIEDLIKPFKTCPSLVGKPKLFFFQACRGDKFDQGAATDSVHENSPKTCYIPRIPIEADFLYSYSTAPGYVAWRDPRLGSPYVQALCNELSTLTRTEDLISILTHVNYTVAYHYSTGPVGDADEDFKQQPSIVSMLSRKLYLSPK